MLDVIRKKRERFEKAKKRSKKRFDYSSDKHRIVVYRSRKYLYAQIIDPESGNVKFSLSSISKELKDQKLGKNVKSAMYLGEELGKKLKGMNIESVCFDRNGYKYHGKIKALADGCRKAGLKF